MRGQHISPPAIGHCGQGWCHRRRRSDRHFADHSALEYSLYHAYDLVHHAGARSFQNGTQPISQLFQ